jgi:hypothetical protein
MDMAIFFYVYDMFDLFTDSFFFLLTSRVLKLYQTGPENYLLTLHVI